MRTFRTWTLQLQEPDATITLTEGARAGATMVSITSQGQLTEIYLRPAEWDVLREAVRAFHSRTDQGANECASPPSTSPPLYIVA